MTISRPQRTPSLLQRRAPQGLPRNPWASPGAQNGPTESDEGTSCLQMFVFVLEGFLILECVQCLGSGDL